MSVNSTYEAIAEMTNGIILAEYKKKQMLRDVYQTEAQLEEELIQNLSEQGYKREYFRTSEELYQNLQVQIERLNDVVFSESEWTRFLQTYLDVKSDGMLEKTRKIQDDYIHDFIFDNGYIKNIYLLDKQNINNNFLQVTNQVTQIGRYKNRYDVTILVNGLPLIQIELKKRGVNLTEAFNQIHRYSKESFNEENSLFKFVQIFVISNGTNTRYFANTTAQEKNNYEFTCEWADAQNHPIKDLVDFTGTFLDKRTLLEVLTKYCVFTVDNTLLIMRPYQIAATERILWKIKTSFENKKWSKADSGGYIWHTTGSGKTLTSFKVARLATELNCIDKVLFVVDRKDLDYQTMKEYQKFQADSVNGSKNTKQLKESLENDDGKIVVTTIQKLNEFMKSNTNHPIFEKQCVLIFDECHRSQFGEAQRRIKQQFKYYYQFGFTGTPIFPENAAGSITTQDVFGKPLHTYIITDAIRDKKVLKFKVDYLSLSPQYKVVENKVAMLENQQEQKQLERETLTHPERISAIASHVLKVYNTKTHRNEFYNHRTKSINGFNALFAVQSIEAAKLYYEEFAKQQSQLPEQKRLKVATIFSVSDNESPHVIGELEDENFTPSVLTGTNRAFLEHAVADYNIMFQTNFKVEDRSFQNYYRDLTKRVKAKEVDLLIVVGMFLTGFDAPTLNTLFVDRNLRYHGLIQAFSRTNRILNKVKTFGNIVCFRNLEEATEEAIKRFGKEEDVPVVLERSYLEYLKGFIDVETGERIRGYEELCQTILEKFPDPTEIVLEADKKEYCKLFGEILKAENILKNYDDFQTFTPIITVGQMQDMKSVYVDIKDEVYRARAMNNIEINFADIEFQIDLLKTEEINIDYILALIFEKSQDSSDFTEMKAEIRRIIRSSIGTRAKEELIIRFIETMSIDDIQSEEQVIESFYTYAKSRKEKEIAILIEDEGLKDGARRFIDKSIEKEHASENGTELDEILPPVSRRAGAREQKKKLVLAKIQYIVDVFSGV